MRSIIAKILYFFFRNKIEYYTMRKGEILCIYSHDQRQQPFEELISWLLLKGYRFITPKELYEYVSGKEQPQEKMVWLSFDDGWKSNYDEVFPVLKKYNIPATIFIATKSITDGYFWFEQAFQNRQSSLFKEVGDLWEMPNNKRVEIIEKLPTYVGPRIAMNESEIREMNESRLITWGNHTHDHVMSDNCSDYELKEEIERCSSIIKKITGNACNYIYSYPNGNYDERSVDILKDMGFKLAATTHVGWTNCPSNTYLIPRNPFNNGCIEENILQSLGIWTSFFDRIKKVVGYKSKK